MDYERALSAPLEHPCYAGHFPGQPIVPGVVLLDLVVMALDRGPPRSVGSVKFHRAVRPGDDFVLRYRVDGPRVTFQCARDGRVLVDGSMAFGESDAAAARD